LPCASPALTTAHGTYVREERTVFEVLLRHRSATARGIPTSPHPSANIEAVCCDGLSINVSRLSNVPTAVRAAISSHSFHKSSRSTLRGYEIIRRRGVESR